MRKLLFASAAMLCAAPAFAAGPVAFNTTLAVTTVNGQPTFTVTSTASTLAGVNLPVIPGINVFLGQSFSNSGNTTFKAAGSTTVVAKTGSTSITSVLFGASLPGFAYGSASAGGAIQ